MTTVDPSILVAAGAGSRLRNFLFTPRAQLGTLLFLVTFALFFQTYAFSFVDYDDLTYVSGDWHIARGLTIENIRWAFTDTHSGNWYPLTLLVEMTVTSIFGMKAGAFHVVNALVHSLNVVMLYGFLCLSTGLTGRSLIVAAFWGWHPLRAESVAWVAEIKDVLCAFFWLGCMLAYQRYRQAPGAGRYLLVLLLDALALMSKPMAVTLPAALFLLDFWPFTPSIKSWRSWSVRVAEKLPLLALSAAAAAYAVLTQKNSGSAGSLHYFPMGLRVINALVAYAAYLWTTVWPLHLGVFYPHPAMLGVKVPISQWAPAALLLAGITIAVLLERKARPYLMVGWFWFIGTALPVIGLVQVGEQARADRYTYLPSIGLVIAAVWWIGDWAVAKQSRRLAVCIAAGLICVATAMAGVRQIGFWRDTETLFTHADAVIPNNYLARSILSAVQRKSGNIQPAISLARSAVAMSHLSVDAHEQLALGLQQDKQRDEALREFIAAAHSSPRRANLRNELGILLSEMKREKDAVAQFREAIRLDPFFGGPRHNLAVILAGQNQLDEAITQWREAIRLNPGDGNLHGWYGEALRLKGDRRAALDQYEAAWNDGARNADWESTLAWYVATDPASTPAQLARIIPIAQDACNQQGGNLPLALDALAAALARVGRFDDAAATAHKATMLARDAGMTQLADKIEERARLYRQGQPYLAGK